MTYGDLPQHESSRAITLADGSTAWVEPRHPMLICQECRAECSANPGDYWDRPADATIICGGCGEPMELVRKITRYEPVNV